MQSFNEKNGRHLIGVKITGDNIYDNVKLFILEF